MDIDQPKYEHKEAAWATDLDSTMLQTWANRGLIEATQSVPGQGRRRLYSIRGLIAVAIAARVVELGVSASLASTISSSIIQAPEFNGDLETFPKVVLTGAMSGGLHLIHLHDLKILIDELNPGRRRSDVYVLVCVDEIVQSVLRKLANLEDAKTLGLI